MRGYFEIAAQLRNFGVLLLLLGFVSTSQADPIYHAGVSPACAGCIVGNHLISPDAHPSVAGLGGSGLSSAGDSLDGNRTYIYDKDDATPGGPLTDLADGIANRDDAGFAMMIWDMGAAFNSIALYTHQDHYAGGLILDNFVGQDVMEYSVWGSHDGDNFVLLSDVTAFALNGGDPTYTFAGTAPNDIYRGGSTEEGIVNAYTRDYTFSDSYRYYGIRSSTITLGYNGGVIIQSQDGDPEIDAVLGHAGPIFTPVPEPSSLLLLGTGLAVIVSRFRGRRTRA
jgi:hypothetical protein